MFFRHSFLDDVDRVAAHNYEPTDNDVLRARLRTVGVQEYRFTLEKGQNDLLRSADPFGKSFMALPFLCH